MSKYGDKNKNNHSTVGSVEFGITAHRDVDNRIESSDRRDHVVNIGGSAIESTSSGVISSGAARSSGTINASGYRFKGFNAKDIGEAIHLINSISEFAKKKRIGSFIETFRDKYHESKRFSEVSLVIEESDIASMVENARSLGIIKDGSTPATLYQALLLLSLLRSIQGEVGKDRVVKASSTLFFKISDDQEKLDAYNNTPEKSYYKERFRRPTAQIQAERSASRFTNNPVNEYQQRTAVRFIPRQPLRHRGSPVTDEMIERYCIQEFFTSLGNAKSSVCKKITPSCLSDKLSIPDKREKPFCAMPLSFLTGARQGPKMRCFTDAFLLTVGLLVGFPIISQFAMCIISPVLGSGRSGDITTVAPSSSECLHSTMNFENIKPYLIFFVTTLLIYAIRKICINSRDNYHRKPVEEFLDKGNTALNLFFEKNENCFKDSSHEASQADESRLLPSTSGVVTSNSDLKDVLVVTVGSDIGTSHAV